MLPLRSVRTIPPKKNIDNQQREITEAEVAPKSESILID